MKNNDYKNKTKPYLINDIMYLKTLYTVKKQQQQKKYYI